MDYGTGEGLEILAIWSFAGAVPVIMETASAEENSETEIVQVYICSLSNYLMFLCTMLSYIYHIENIYFDLFGIMYRCIIKESHLYS